MSTTLVDQTQLKNTGFVTCTRYLWTAQSPGGTLSIGANTITLSPVPLGVNWNDPLLRLWVSGGTGTAEACAVVSTGPGTAVSGAASGTITITCANNHSGSWTVSSTSAGVYEAIAGNPGREVHVPSGHYVMHYGITLNPDIPLILTGEGFDRNSTDYGSYLNFTGIPDGVHAFSLTNSTVANFVTFRGLRVIGPNTAGAGDGFHCSSIVRATWSGMQINGFGHGIFGVNSFEMIVEEHCCIEYNAKWGVNFNGVTNLVKVSDCEINFNSRSNGFGNLIVTDGWSVCITGNGIEAAGTAPFTTVTAAFGLYCGNINALIVSGNYFEANLGGSPFYQVIYASGVAGLTEFGNTFSSAGTSAVAVTYDVGLTALISFGNNFFGATSYRTLNSSDFSTYNIGPDVSISGSPESTNHPRILGCSGQTGGGSASLGANCPAFTATAPYVWLRVVGPDGNTVFIPAWR